MVGRGGGAVRPAPPMQAAQAMRRMAIGSLVWLAFSVGCGGGRKSDAPFVGTLEIEVATLLDGTSERWFFLRSPDGLKQRLRFEAAPDLTPGDDLEVWGEAVGEEIAVERFRAHPAP